MMFRQEMSKVPPSYKVLIHNLSLLLFSITGQMKEHQMETQVLY